MLTAGALVRDGYFPRELPPSFNADGLADLYEGHGEELELPTKPTECVRHNLARAGGTRRALGVPNPGSYLGLAVVIESLWTTIDTHLASQHLATSRPVVTPDGPRAVGPRVHVREQPELRARLWRGQRFVLEGDVSQCYPSLYTHAIPWALHSKKEAKANKNETAGDELDRAIRRCSSGQTVGVPVGPDTSFVVAEIVLTAVDAQLTARLPGLRGSRYIDDYELAFPTRAKAEEAEATLESALADFELVVNPLKTRIVELPQPLKRTWTHELSTFSIRTETTAMTSNDLVALFSRAAELAAEYQGTLTYALRKSQDVDVASEWWDTFQALVWNAVSVEPTTMALALDLLRTKAAALDEPVDREAAAEVIEALLTRHAPVRNASELVWGLWAAITLELELSDSASSAISATEDDFVALVALHAQACGVFPANALDTTTWESLIDDPDAAHGNHWLLAYEATVKDWLESAEEAIAKDPFFARLREAGVEFFDPEREWDPFTGPAGPLPGAPEWYA